MSERTITFTGTVSLAEAKRLIAEAEAPRLTVGQWVQRTTEPWGKARQITSIGEQDIWCLDGYANRHTVRPATDAEIAEAKRIEPKVGMLVRHRTTGDVYRYLGDEWQVLSSIYHGKTWITPTTDGYEVLDSYTLKGAQ